MVTERVNRLASVLVQRHRESAFYDVEERKKYTYSNRGLALEKYANNPDIFGSFTSLPKLGINPSTKYNTPIGVYCYPVNYIVEHYDDSSAEFDVPFAGSESYLYIFSVKDLERALEFDPEDTTVVSSVKNPMREFPVSNIQGAAINEALQRARQYVGEHTNKDLMRGGDKNS